jgi:hypothetical protein
MSRQHIFRVVFASIIREPDPVLIVLPDERLHREIDCQGSALCHRKRPRFGVAENDDRSRPHVQFGLFGRGGVIDPAENDPACRGMRIDRGLKIIGRFLNRMRAWFGDKSIVRGRGNGMYREHNRRYDQDLCQLAIVSPVPLDMKKMWPSAGYYPATLKNES